MRKCCLTPAILVNMTKILRIYRKDIILQFYKTADKLYENSTAFSPKAMKTLPGSFN
jgi:hypothetical protein